MAVFPESAPERLARLCAIAGARRIAMAQGRGMPIVLIRAAMAALFVLGCTSFPAGAGSDATTSGLPVPRFVTLKADRVMVRGGPDKAHDVAWIYTRAGWPVGITAEFENCRRIPGCNGPEALVCHSLLTSS